MAAAAAVDAAVAAVDAAAAVAVAAARRRRRTASLTADVRGAHHEDSQSKQVSNRGWIWADGDRATLAVLSPAALRRRAEASRFETPEAATEALVAALKAR